MRAHHRSTCAYARTIFDLAAAIAAQIERDTEMVDQSHLNALEVRLSHERDRLAKAKTSKERELRTVWVDQAKKEIAAERAFLGLEPEIDLPVMSDDELLAELQS